LRGADRNLRKQILKPKKIKLPKKVKARRGSLPKRNRKRRRWYGILEVEPFGTRHGGISLL